MALPQPKRAPGTYVTLDKARLGTLLMKMGTGVAVMLYLETKTNYDHDGATLGELIDALGRSPKTIQNTLSILKSQGEVLEEGGRFYPGEGLPKVIRDELDSEPSRHLSRTPSRGLARDLSRKSGNGGAEKLVTDDATDPLKEEKEEKEKKEEKITTTPTPPSSSEPSRAEESGWGDSSNQILRQGHSQVFGRLATLKRDTHSAEGQFGAWCRAALPLVREHGEEAVRLALDDVITNLSSIKKPWAYFLRRVSSGAEASAKGRGAGRERPHLPTAQELFDAAVAQGLE